MNSEKFKQQMQFILEIDKAKNIFRQTYLSDGKRKENDAEHSWHLAMMAFVLSEYVENVDILKVIKIVLMHDLVEIYAGDTYCYDTVANQDKLVREMQAAKKIYGLLPTEQGEQYMDLWLEFEAGKSAEARFAALLDRIQPIMLNYATHGKAWIEHGVYEEDVRGRNQILLETPGEFSAYLLDIIEKSVGKGFLKTHSRPV